MNDKFIKDYKIIEKSDIDVLEMLNNTRINAKSEFLADDSLIEPRNTYGNLDINTVNKNIEMILNRLEKTFDDDLEDQVIKKLLEENYHKNHFVQLCHSYNVGEISSTLLEEYQKENIVLYDDINRDTFEAILCQELQDIENSEILTKKKNIYLELMDILPVEIKTKKTPYIPTRDLFYSFGELCKAYLKNILNHVPIQDIYTPQDVCNIANEIFKSEFSDSEWRAVVKEGKGFASVSQENNVFYIPGNRSKGDYGYVDVIGLFAHEIGVHVLRGYPFRNNPIKALSKGVPGYIKFEEGLATAVQHSIENSYVPVGHMHYVSIGLATFCHLSFRQVFEIQWRIHELLQDENKSRCFDSVQRAFRGTNHLVNNKDLAYYEGNKKVWQYIEKHMDEDSFITNLWSKGKIDPTDSFWSMIAGKYTKMN